jgi:hypothetical protein
MPVRRAEGCAMIWIASGITSPSVESSFGGSGPSKASTFGSPGAIDAD